VGEGRGRGFTLNLPLPAGCGDAEYAALYRQVVAPVARAFDPQLVLVSAGFDPHQDDPLAGMRLTPAGFADVMSACLETAAGAAASRVVAALEGGYDLAGIEASAAEVTKALLGDPVPRLGHRSALADRLVAEARRRFDEFWPL
jgi:acetoin utilization deacetylase AcuC-like enzyme